MAAYHKYVFDQASRSLVGDWEKMYQQEAVEGFDSWHQEDSRQLQRMIALQILGMYNFGKILDVGCGKGAFTHLMKKRNNEVIGVDVSETAIATAAVRYPDISFCVADVTRPDSLSDVVRKFSSPGTDLAVCAEILSYVSDWQGLLREMARHTRHLLVCLDIPSNPIGFVKSPADLVAGIAADFTIIEAMELKVSGFSIVFATTKNQES
ncbi:MAG: class I SAM-dependent methyltransferase [Chthoniobacterales bacterium]|jgi:2-polyprenyl-3-methyl-5-hydroxy-6-metoxy-1,4-benzoquinol methylase|nr:class I SAM-dependent methyltransferase [Chthoniobacterales bacterium]